MWKTDITDSDLIDEEKADFVLAQAKEQLAATEDDAEAQTRTGVYLLGGLVTVTSGLVGVTAALFDNVHSFAGQRWASILPLLATVIYLGLDIAIVMWSALSSKELEHSGNAPSNLATQNLFRLELRLIKFAEAIGYEERIEKNHRRNENVGARINLAIKMACLAPLVYLAVLLISRFIFRS